MAFDFVAFFKQENTFYRTEGKNVKRGNVNIKCPFCGAGDPSEHLGVNIKTGQWGCLRSSAHRGSKPHRLIMVLRRCSWDEADGIVADKDILGEDISWGALKERLVELPTDNKITHQYLDGEFLFKSVNTSGLRRRFWLYLKSRGFRKRDVLDVCHKYRLRCALDGRFAGRLIFPFMFNHRVMGWTGRATSKAELRYLSYPNSSVIKKILYNYDGAAEGGHTLVVTEGPLDCLKVDYYGRQHEVRAIGLLGLSVTEAQISLLVHLSARFDKVLLLLDANATSQSLELQSRLPVPVTVGVLDHVEDPGELKPGEILPTVLACIR